MLRRISSVSAGRRSKWVILAIWVVLGVGLAQLQPQLQEATTNENEAFLPSSAESTAANRLIEDRFRDGREVDALIVYHRDGGLTAADQARILADAQRLGEPEVLQGAGTPISPFPAAGGTDPSSASAGSGPSLVSEDGSTALLVVPTFSEDSDEIQANTAVIREIVPDPDADGLQAYVTGTAGFISDSIEVFESIDVTLLLVTVTLVLVLLLIIYRSIVVALVPIFVVGLAYLIAAAAVLGLVRAGAFEVNGQTTALLIVLMFGAGTDYCLLIVARYREELRRIPSKHEAMIRATERTAPAILSAGGTVFAAMLVLSLADFKATATMGPVLALGIAIMVLAGLTLLPALLAVLGRRAFWPSVPKVAADDGGPSPIWTRVGNFVHDRPVAVLLSVTAVLILGSLGNFQDRGVLDFGEGFRTDPDSKVGQQLIEDNLTPGQAAASNVVVATPIAADVATALEQSDGVEAVVAVSQSDDGELTSLDVTLAADPFSDQASAWIPELRELAGDASGGEIVLVGGITAENFDTSETLGSDARLIVPLVLLVIFIILAILLRAVIAPLYLVATVVLSFAFALGASKLIFSTFFDQPDSDPGLATFAFIFLVALGVDYNIFLISRIREESAKVGNKEGVITGLARTGAVITSAGLILAGTFGALMSLPLVGVFQLGFTIALGLLVDTFLVRTALVPSIAFLLGDLNWWPSRRGQAPGVAQPPGSADTPPSPG